MSDSFDRSGRMDLSLHILDIAQNALRAGARRVEITLEQAGSCLTVTIRDNGCGMPPEVLCHATEESFTTKPDDRGGRGLPLYRAAAEAAGGWMKITSSYAGGTTVTARFDRTSSSCPPLGDMAETLYVLTQGAPETDFLYRCFLEGQSVHLDTALLRELPEAAVNWPALVEAKLKEQIQE